MILNGFKWVFLWKLYYIVILNIILLNYHFHITQLQHMLK